MNSISRLDKGFTLSCTRMGSAVPLPRVVLRKARTGYWLRWWDEAGNLLLWAVEQIEQERQRAEQERQQKERLIAYLQSQGIDPNNFT
ncbi:hypothetical protein [Nostoc commune]|uniref:hypothetical protein n=1 Tax=Nostoc commune TaxID=1178 RepID=UPI0018C6FB6E|nr:hypothetical protein [Nostoc commune]